MADIDIGKISEALNNKTDRNMRNVDTGAKADSVIDYQEPTAENGYTWYRKYASGWVEQGGETYNDNASGTQQITVVMPIEMSDTHYCFHSGTGYSGNDADTYGQRRESWTTTSFVLLMTSKAYGENKNVVWWTVCGKSA